GETASSAVAQATLRLSGDGTLSATTGCRAVTGRYTLSEGQVQVTLDPYDTIACAAPLGDQDAHILGVLSNGFAASIDGDQLTLTAGDKGLSYRAEG
ncbi:MAG TPA: META domain-containing protein, partial [Candidatus Limnocylindria bacterium]